ncbi:MAG TPA: hypothetical protein VLV88_07340, partial [Terriglobales bacterium]|nr:hypothetical protein [Terriglobales bacterium]
LKESEFMPTVALIRRLTGIARLRRVYKQLDAVPVGQKESIDSSESERQWQAARRKGIEYAQKMRSPSA